MDILRGIAVFGILLVTIQSYSMPTSAYLNPTTYERLEGYDLWVWVVTHVFADKKFLAIFAMLFGASMIMLSNKARKEHLRSGDLQSRRFVWLLILGLAHAYLLWYGDMLVAFAICGFFMFIFRSRKTKVLFRTGIIFLAIGSLISLILGYSVPFWEPGQFNELRAEIWTPDEETQAKELEYYLSNWERQMIHRAPEAFQRQTIVFVTETFWRVSGLMLLGMAFYKKRVFGTKQTRKYYRRMIIYGLGIGLPLVVAGVLLNFNFDWEFRKSYYYISQLNYWGSTLMAIGYIGIVMLLAKVSTRGPLPLRLSQVGQMSLTNYVLQSVICTTIFYGHGMSLFGNLDRSALAFVVVMIWVFQFIFSALWLSYFKYGPLEWLWRSLSYGRAQPLYKT